SAHPGGIFRALPARHRFLRTGGGRVQARSARRSISPIGCEWPYVGLSHYRNARGGRFPLLAVCRSDEPANSTVSGKGGRLLDSPADRRPHGNGGDVERQVGLANLL